ncbi:MAG: hypothetical protein EKK36_05320 [Bradyrhizobiaceae bacterium]|nr:MAG: hypothetical protein EKK36_05320 [Bradyrhizobiaceae bacterium]
MSFYSRTGIEKDGHKIYRSLRRAFQESRRRKLITPGDRQCIRPMEWRGLGFWNGHARRCWGRAFSKEIASLAEWDSRNQRHGRPVYLLTVADNSGAVSVDQRPDLQSIKRKLVTELRGLNFIGMLEPAFYLNLQSGVNVQHPRCIYWHLHALVWDISYQQLRQIVTQLNRSGLYGSIADGLDPVDVVRVRQMTLPAVVAYLLKPPVNGYRISKCDRTRNGVVVTDSDGVVLEWFRQSKAELRMGELVQLFYATRNVTLDQLLTSGGGGTEIARRIRRQVNEAVQRGRSDPYAMSKHRIQQFKKGRRLPPQR